MLPTPNGVGKEKRAIITSTAAPPGKLPANPHAKRDGDSTCCTDKTASTLVTGILVFYRWLWLFGFGCYERVCSSCFSAGRQPSRLPFAVDRLSHVCKCLVLEGGTTFRFHFWPAVPPSPLPPQCVCACVCVPTVHRNLSPCPVGEEENGEHSAQMPTLRTHPPGPGLGGKDGLVFFSREDSKSLLRERLTET
jgi:hypothetical protein